MAWPARESQQLRAPLLANTLSGSVLEQASSSQEVVEMLAMLASSLQVLLCSWQTTHHLSSTTFAKRLGSVAILRASLSATSGASSSSVRCRSSATTYVHPRTFL